MISGQSGESCSSSFCSPFFLSQAASSTLAEMAEGTHFKPVIADNSPNLSDVNKIIFCCGKHYYELEKQRNNRSIKDTAIVRIEVRFPCAITTLLTCTLSNLYFTYDDMTYIDALLQYIHPNAQWHMNPPY